jgi:hypothetical protein
MTAKKYEKALNHEHETMTVGGSRQRDLRCRRARDMIAQRFVERSL